MNLPNLTSRKGAFYSRSRVFQTRVCRVREVLSAACQYKALTAASLLFLTVAARVSAVPALPDMSAPDTGVQEMRYPNGLVLLSKEVHAAPVVSIWTVYNVGSRDETPGLFGISHQVEHMMFKGTPELRPGDIDRLFSEKGGVNNAETTQDYTAYNETLPSSALPVALRVEADRMEHSTMDATELAHEKTVVLSELQGDENSPLYKLDTAVTGAAFSLHPYRNPVGGFLWDVRRFTPAEVKHYYRSHYSSNTATLVVVGDFNTAALQRAVGYYFARNHTRPIARPLINQELPQTAERRVTTSGVGDTAYVELAYHVPKTGSRDHYVMDVISSVLGSGRSSRLYRAVVQKGLATEVEAGDPDMKDPYLMEITATVARGHTQAEVEAAIEEEIEKLKREPVSAQELQKTVNQVKANFVYRDDSVTQQASELGSYAAIISYRYMDTYLQQISTVSPEEIQQAASTYFTRENRTVGWFIPRAPRPGEAVPSTGRGGGIHYKLGDVSPALKPWMRRQVEMSGKPAVKLFARPLAPTPSPVSLERLIGRRFRRRSVHHARPPSARHSHHPQHSQHSRRVKVSPGPPATLLAALVPPPSRSHLAVYRELLPNGLVVIVYPNHTNPDVSISGSIRAGSFQDPRGQSGLASFTAAMLDRGTTTRTEDQIAAQLDFVGATVDVSAEGSATFFTAHSLAENWPLTLDIVSDEIRHPAFPDGVFDRVKNELQTAIQEGNEDPTTSAVQNLFAELYPEDYPLHWPVIGTADTLRSLTRSDLEAFHQQYYRPDLTTVVVVGDVEPLDAVAQVQRYFGNWTAAGPAPLLEPPAIFSQGPSRRVIKTMPDKSEAVVAMGFRGITRRDPDYYPAYLMNLILGNSDFNSRFMKDIRDKKGLAYYAGSSWDAGLLPGPWLLQMETNPANVDKAVAAARADMALMQRTGALPAEVKLFKSWVTGNQALKLETNAGIADILMQSEFFGLGMDYLWRYPTIIRSVSMAQIRDAALRLLHPENLVTSIAGPYPAGAR